MSTIKIVLLVVSFILELPPTLDNSKGKKNESNKYKQTERTCMPNLLFGFLCSFPLHSSESWVGSSGIINSRVSTRRHKNGPTRPDQTKPIQCHAMPYHTRQHVYLQCADSMWALCAKEHYNVCVSVRYRIQCRTFVLLLESPFNFKRATSLHFSVHIFGFLFWSVNVGWMAWQRQRFDSSSAIYQRLVVTLKFCIHLWWP